MRGLKKEQKIELAVQELENLYHQERIRRLELEVELYEEEEKNKKLKEVLEEDLNVRKCDYCSEWKHNYDDRCNGPICEDCYLERNGIFYTPEEWELKSSFHAEDRRMEN